MLFVVLRPVDSELAVVEVELDRLETLLFVVLRPVDSELPGRASSRSSSTGW